MTDPYPDSALVDVRFNKGEYAVWVSTGQNVLNPRRHFTAAGFPQPSLLDLKIMRVLLEDALEFVDRYIKEAQ